MNKTKFESKLEEILYMNNPMVLANDVEPARDMRVERLKSLFLSCQEYILGEKDPDVVYFRPGRRDLEQEMDNLLRNKLREEQMERAREVYGKEKEEK